MPDGNLTHMDRIKYATLIKKGNKIFLIYKDIQMGPVANSYMRKGFLIYEESANIEPYKRRS